MNFDKLRSRLIRSEGLRQFPYVDTVGKTTIGVGHNLTDKGLTSQQIMGILDNDIKDTLAFLDSRLSWWTQLDDVRQVALADLTFNLMNKLLGFKRMLAALQAKDWNTAADELLNSKFAIQTGQRSRDLAAMFRTGRYVV